MSRRLTYVVVNRSTRIDQQNKILNIEKTDEHDHESQALAVNVCRVKVHTYDNKTILIERAYATTSQQQPHIFGLHLPYGDTISTTVKSRTAIM